MLAGNDNDGFILTLIEWRCRPLLAVKLATKRLTEACSAVVDALMDRLVIWVKTLTFDNGAEFRGHERMTVRPGSKVYFAGPFSAYQRGSNERVNGLIRRCLPKGTPFRDRAQQRLEKIAAGINN